MQLSANDIAGRHRFQELRLQILGVGGHEAQPPDARDLLDLADQGSQAAATIGVVIVIDVLSKQHDLFRAGLDCGRTFAEHLPHRDVALAATDAGHDAERAVVVAALNDAHVMTDAGAPGGGQRLAFRVVVTGLEAGEEIVVFADGYDCVKVRETALELIAFLGHDAAGDRDGPLWRLPRFESSEACRTTQVLRMATSARSSESSW